MAFVLSLCGLEDIGSFKPGQAKAFKAAKLQTFWRSLQPVASRSCSKKRNTTLTSTIFLGWTNLTNCVSNASPCVCSVYECYDVHHRMSLVQLLVVLITRIHSDRWPTVVLVLTRLCPVSVRLDTTCHLQKKDRETRSGQGPVREKKGAA